MDCPRCQVELVINKETANCPDGHGRFIPAAALATKVSINKRLANAAATLPSIPCPACAQTMTLLHPKGFDIDACPCGGIWLDAGEEKVLREFGGTAFRTAAVVDVLANVFTLLG